MLTKLRKYGVQPIVATQSVDDVRAACRGPAKSEDLSMGAQPRPIDTAPRTGSYFVGCTPDGARRWLCYWDRESDRFESETGGRAPLHWIDDEAERSRLLGCPN
jgi:hypothetical protein